MYIKKLLEKWLTLLLLRVFTRVCVGFQLLIQHHNINTNLGTTWVKNSGKRESWKVEKFLIASWECPCLVYALDMYLCIEHAKLKIERSPIYQICSSYTAINKKNESYQHYSNINVKIFFFYCQFI